MRIMIFTRAKVENDQSHYTVVVLYPTPRGHNFAGLTWAEAVVQSKVGGSTQLAEGSGKLKISAQEKSDIEDGKLLEVSFAWPVAKSADPVSRARDLFAKARETVRLHWSDIRDQIEHYGTDQTEPDDGSLTENLHPPHVTFSETLVPERAQAIVDAIDAADDAAKLYIYTRNYTTLLASVTLGDPSFTVVDGVLVMSGAPKTAPAFASGTPEVARLLTGDDVIVVQGLSVGISGADVTVNTIDIVEGQTLTVASATFPYV
jgi:hypothetical protein